MTVYIHLKGSKGYVEVPDTNDIEGVWGKITRGEPIQTGRYPDDKTIVNKDNVTTVRSGR